MADDKNTFTSLLEKIGLLVRARRAGCPVPVESTPSQTESPFKNLTGASVVVTGGHPPVGSPPGLMNVSQPYAAYPQLFPPPMPPSVQELGRLKALLQSAKATGLGTGRIAGQIVYYDESSKSYYLIDDEGLKSVMGSLDDVTAAADCTDRQPANFNGNTYDNFAIAGKTQAVPVTRNGVNCDDWFVIHEEGPRPLIRFVGSCDMNIPVTCQKTPPKTLADALAERPRRLISRNHTRPEV